MFRTVSRRLLPVVTFSGSVQEFHALVNKGPAVVDFYTTWCGPCTAVAPKFEAMSDEYKNVTFVKVDCEANDEVAAEHNIRSIPTFVVYKDGAVQHTVEGANISTVESHVKGL